MKTLSRLFSAAFILFAAVSCGTKEIDHPDIPDTPQDSEITITASIIQTRVSYDCSDPGEVKQEWEVGDILFGFWGGSTSNQIVFKVKEVDSVTGVATLEAESGADWIEEATVSGASVDLVYTGGEAKFTGNGIDVDLSGQTLDRVPGCMHAQATLQIDGDGNKSLEFYFQNDCALIEIESLGLPVTMSLSSIEVTNLLMKGKYYYDGNQLKLGSEGYNVQNYTIDLHNGVWTLEEGGVINGPNDAKILIAVVPNQSEKDIKITAKSVGDGSQSASIPEYIGKSFSPGNCYVISADPYVAKIDFGNTVEYYRTVSSAFAAAKESGRNDLTVVLIKDQINGFGEQTASPTHTSTIEIDYPVTLDLNGCTLLLSEAEQFYLEYPFNVFDNPGTLTIQDSTGPNSTGVYAGTISSDSSNSILYNYGVVNIHGGNLKYYGDNNLIHNSGTVNISDGFLESYAESDEGNEEYYSVVYNEATLNIYGGTLNSGDCDTIRNNESGTVTISGGTITSEDNRAITNYGDLSISGGKLSSSAGYVSSTAEGYVDEDSEGYEDQNCRGTIYNWSNLTITGGTIVSEYCRALYNSGTTTITGGTINAEDDMAIKNFADLTVGKTPAESNDAISIISGSTYYESDIPAIYCDGGSLDMYYGTVTCPAGAVILKNGSTATISGGYFSSTDYSTVQILDGSQCSISGGVFVSSGFGVGTIAFYGGNATSTLSITWPAGISNPSPDTTHEPLIYSGDTGSATSLPISTFIGQGNKQPAQITIEGGYLISSNNDVNRFLYDASGDNLKVWDTENDEAIFGNFYSNVTNVLLYEKTGAKDHNLTLTTENNQVIYGHSFEAIKQSGTGFTIPVIDESTGILYKIMPK